MIIMIIMIIIIMIMSSTNDKHLQQSIVKHQTNHYHKNNYAHMLHAWTIYQHVGHFIS